jgi:hypothetical protein
MQNIKKKNKKKKKQNKKLEKTNPKIIGEYKKT